MDHLGALANWGKLPRRCRGGVLPLGPLHSGGGGGGGSGSGGVFGA